MTTVRTYDLTHEWTTRAFLCDRHAEERERAGWTVVMRGRVPHRCDDCVTAEQKAPGYVTLTV